MKFNCVVKKRIVCSDRGEVSLFLLIEIEKDLRLDVGDVL
jgi:hypothetical protein